MSFVHDERRNHIAIHFGSLVQRSRSFLYPQYFVYRGYLEITLSVCSCLGHNFLPPCPIWIVFHIIAVHDQRSSVSWLWTKVISPRPRSHRTHTQNLYPGHNSSPSLPCWIWIIFHTSFVHYSRVCHDIDPRSYLQGQSHRAHRSQCTHTPKSVSGP